MGLVLILCCIALFFITKRISKGIGDSFEVTFKEIYELSKTPKSSEHEKIDSLHRRLGKPLPGEWLSAVNEPGQTFEEYTSSRPNGKTKERDVIYIRPIGSFSNTEKEVLITTSKYLSQFYAVRVEILDSISVDLIPNAARRNHQNNYQLSAKYILDDLISPNIPNNAAAYIALTKIDLYNDPQKNFVFGLGNLKNRSGIYSLARLGNLEDGYSQYNRFLLRTLKVASHEVGHTFGIMHCIEYKCIMNGSNSMSESDSKPVYLCPVDLKKICWNFKINKADRFNDLKSFWAEIGFKENSEFYDWNLSLLNSQSLE